jgi:PadR family transcriptional regulator AphA
MLKNILLGFLNYGPMTGYKLKQTIDTSTSFFWHAHHSQIYTTLRQMEKEGLVSSLFKHEDDALRRRVYTLTDKGKKALNTWLDTPMTEVSQVKEDFLVRMFFSARRDPEQVMDELKEQKRLHQDMLKGYQQLQDSIPHYGHPKFEGIEREQKFWNLTLEMGFLFEKMYLEWLDIAINSIQSG